MSDVLLRCEQVGKKFCRDLKKSLWYGIQDLTTEMLGFVSSDRDAARADLRRDEFWAIQDVGFELKRGECLGLIGSNGAGKTTLLKMINGLIKPDEGRIMLRGRVAGLIALGAGFDPILTGRENIFVNGSILGFSKKQIAARLDEIVSFAELEEFIDSPVGNYSSGMQVRLGFAVAAILIKPDILLLDEVLAVGDLGFRLKCLNLVQSLLEDSAVVFVSHSMQFVTRFCSRVAVLAPGRMVCNTPHVAEGLQAYYRLCETDLITFGNTDAKISHERLLINDLPVEEAVIGREEELSIELDLELAPGVPTVELRIMIEDLSGHPVLTINAESREELRFSSSRLGLKINLGKLNLSPGKYHFSFAVVTVEQLTRLTRKSGNLSFQFGGDHVEWASVIHNAEVSAA